MTTSTDRIVIYPQLRSDFGIRYSRQHLARLEKSGGFPQRIQESANRVGWLESELSQWIGSRAAARQAVAA